jgi:hypothetical protein
LGSRASAAKDAVIDKKDEASHNTKADVHKGKIMEIQQAYGIESMLMIYRGHQALNGCSLKLDYWDNEIPLLLALR